MKNIKKLPFIISILSFLTIFVPAGTKIVKNDNIDMINGNFFMFFICFII